jgi:hypothetical protein
MNLVDILFNAAGGGVLGSILHCVTDYIDTKNKITMMNAQIAAAEKTEAWKAFAASQEGNESLAIPANASPIMINIYLGVDAIKQLTRPFLTWCAILIVAGMYFNASESAQKEMQSEILFGSFTAIFWYFGARYAKSK